MSIEVPRPDEVVEQDGRLVIAGNGRALTAEDIRELRLTDQRQAFAGGVEQPMDAAVEASDSPSAAH